MRRAEATLESSCVSHGGYVQYSGRLDVSVLTVGELRTWSSRRNAPASRAIKIEQLLLEVNVLAVDASVSRAFAELRARQLDTGRLTPPVDLWIASTAIAHDLNLVTHNTRDFQGIPGLALADWLLP